MARSTTSLSASRCSATGCCRIVKEVLEGDHVEKQQYAVDGDVQPAAAIDGPAGPQVLETARGPNGRNAGGASLSPRRLSLATRRPRPSPNRRESDRGRQQCGRRNAEHLHRVPRRQGPRQRGHHVAAGEIHSLLGENGAGKSTLIKALTGVYAIDSGTIKVAGATRMFHGTADAQDAGVAPVYQEVNLCSNLTVGENVMLGHEVRGQFGINWKATHAKASTYLEELGPRHRPALAPCEPLARGAAARRHQPRRGHSTAGSSCSTSPPLASTAPRSNSSSPSCAAFASATSRSCSSRTSSTRSTRSRTP